MISDAIKAVVSSEGTTRTIYGFPTSNFDVVAGEVEIALKLINGIEVSKDSTKRAFGEDDLFRLNYTRYTHSLAEEELEQNDLVREATNSAIRARLSAELPRKANVVEVGAGGGLFTKEAIYPVVKHKRGVVFATEATNHAESLQALRGRISQEVICMPGVEAKELSFAPDDSVDAIVGITVLDMFSPKDVDEMAKEFHRKLVKGGKVIEMRDMAASLGFAISPTPLQLDAYNEYLKLQGVLLEGKDSYALKMAESDFNSMKERMGNLFANLGIPFSEEYIMIVLTKIDLLGTCFQKLCDSWGKRNTEIDIENFWTPLLCAAFLDEENRLAIDMCESISRNKGIKVDLLELYTVLRNLSLFAKNSEKINPDFANYHLSEVFQAINNFCSEICIKEAFENNGFKVKIGTDIGNRTDYNHDVSIVHHPGTVEIIPMNGEKDSCFKSKVRYIVAEKL